MPWAPFFKMVIEFDKNLFLSKGYFLNDVISVAYGIGNVKGQGDGFAIFIEEDACDGESLNWSEGSNSQPSRMGVCKSSAWGKGRI
jgi:hypothetical protein